MFECSMALRYDERGSNFSKPYYNGRGGGGKSGSGGKEKRWNGGYSGSGSGRFSGDNIKESASSSAENHFRKHERKSQSSSSKNQKNWDNQSKDGDSAEKPQLKQIGDWTEHLSSTGKKYYYNCRTEVSQWEKPVDWIAWEKEQDMSNSMAEEEPAQAAVDSAPADMEVSMQELFKEELVAHVRGWSAEHFEVQASQLANDSFRLSMDVMKVSADLKCVRSLVRTAEIRSTLLAQRIAYLRQQYHELDTMSKPTPSSM